MNDQHVKNYIWTPKEINMRANTNFQSFNILYHMFQIKLIRKEWKTVMKKFNTVLLVFGYENPPVYALKWHSLIVSWVKIIHPYKLLCWFLKYSLTFNFVKMTFHILIFQPEGKIQAINLTSTFTHLQHQDWHLRTPQTPCHQYEPTKCIQAYLQPVPTQSFQFCPSVPQAKSLVSGGFLNFIMIKGCPMRLL